MNEERGSAKIIRERMGGSGVIGEKDLELIARLTKLDNVKLARWWWLGQPAPDVVSGVLDLHRDKLGEVISGLLQTEVPLVVKVFPKGIPWPEEAILTFKSGLE